MKESKGINTVATVLPCGDGTGVCFGESEGVDDILMLKGSGGFMDFHLMLYMLYILMYVPNIMQIKKQKANWT